MTENSTGKMLRELRGERRLEEVANAVGVGVSSIVMYESGQRVPRDNVKRKLADYFNKSVAEIFFPDDAHSH